MQYVDTNILIDMHEYYFPTVFDTVWDKVKELSMMELWFPLLN